MTSASLFMTSRVPSSVSRIAVPPNQVVAVISSRNELVTRASSPRLSLLAGSQSAFQLVGACGYASVLVTRVMYQETAPIPLMVPSS